MKLRKRDNKKPAIIENKSESEDDKIDVNRNLIDKSKTTNKKKTSKKLDEDDTNFEVEAKKNELHFKEKKMREKTTNTNSRKKNKPENAEENNLDMKYSEYFSNTINKQAKSLENDEPIKLKKRSVEPKAKNEKISKQVSTKTNTDNEKDSQRIKEEPKQVLKSPIKKSAVISLPSKLECTSCHEKSQNLEDNIENLLKMETLVAKTSKDSELMDDSDDSDETDEAQKESDEDDAFEEVEMENTAENEMKLAKMNKGGIQVTIDPKAKKNSKNVDMAAKMERMFKSMQKKLNVTMIKTHLVCWLNHGFYLNSIIVNDFVRAITLSIDKFNIENFNLFSLNEKNIADILIKMNKLLIKHKNEEEKNSFLAKNQLITSENMIEAISSLKCSNYLQYILIILTALRNMNIKARLCVCFNVISMNDDREKKLNNASKSKVNTKSSKQISSNLTKQSAKRKSEEVYNLNEEKPKKKRLRKNKKNESLSEDTEEDEEQVEKDKETNTDEDFTLKFKKSPNKKENENKIKVITKSNNKILSSDTDETNRDVSKESKIENDTVYRNYWIEVYLEKEKTWCPVDPIEMVFNNAEHFERRFGKRILYVCAYDNENKVKDVTKRYSHEWLTNTRLLRIGHLDDRKLWWDTTLMYHEPLDVNLDIEEEKQLKKMLLEKEFPSSLSEFKDHPLYVLKRHLLKYQAIYPHDAQPAGMFRDEPVYYRDNLSTLHSRQTWLKLARVVKPFEKTYKVVKGRLKMSEYKAGMRDNPDLDLFGYWQTKKYDPPIAENGRVPRNEFGNVELFQPHMIPVGCVHLRNMPNLNRVCRKLGIDCAAAVTGFDAHGGFSHAVYDGWIVCEEFKETVTMAFEEEKRNEQKRAMEKREAKVLNNWAHLVKLLLIRERLKKKYENKISMMNKLALDGKNSLEKDGIRNVKITSIETNEVGAKLNKPVDEKMDIDGDEKENFDEEIEKKVYEKMPINSNKNTKAKAIRTNNKIPHGSKKSRVSRKKTPTPSNSSSESDSDESEDDGFKSFIQSRPSRNAKLRALTNVKKMTKKESAHTNELKSENESEKEEKFNLAQTETKTDIASTSQPNPSKFDKSDDLKLSESDSD